MEPRSSESHTACLCRTSRPKAAIRAKAGRPERGLRSSPRAFAARHATTTTDLNVVTSEASGASSLLLRRATTSTNLNVVTLEVAVRNGFRPGAQKRTFKTIQFQSLEPTPFHVRAYHRRALFLMRALTTSIYSQLCTVHALARGRLPARNG